MGRNREINIYAKRNDFEINKMPSSIFRDQLFFLALIVSIFVGSGCVSVASRNNAAERVLSEENQMLRTIALSMDQKSFDAPKSILIKAIINAFANKNLTVVTLEEDSGYMMSEGTQMLNDQILSELASERSKIISTAGNLAANDKNWPYMPKVYIKVSVNLYKKPNQKTLIKMKINYVNQNCLICLDGVCRNIPGPLSYCPPSPKMVSLWYQQLWAEIEKSIFMQRETILN
jgi:hypothetical protein